MDIIEPVAISLAASVLTSASFVAMKHSHNVGSYSFWIFGLLTLVLGSILNIIALGVGDQILFSVTTSFSIVLNTIFSQVFLGETLKQSDFIGIMMVVLGSLFFMMVAKSNDKTYT